MTGVTFTWATVTAVNPLAIKLDGDSASLGLIPDSLVDPLSLTVGDRVRVEQSLRRVVVHGRSGGDVSARPSILLVPNAQQITATNFTFTAWDPPGTGLSFASPGGSSFFSVSGGIVTCLKAGLYNFRVMLSLGVVAGGAVAWYLVRNNNPAGADIVAADTVLSSGSYSTFAKIMADSVVMAAGDTLRLFSPASTGAYGVGGAGRSQGQFFAEVVGL